MTPTSAISEMLSTYGFNPLVNDVYLASQGNLSATITLPDPAFGETYTGWEIWETENDIEVSKGFHIKTHVAISTAAVMMRVELDELELKQALTEFASDITEL